MYNYDFVAEVPLKLELHQTWYKEIDPMFVNKWNSLKLHACSQLKVFPFFAKHSLPEYNLEK